MSSGNAEVKTESPEQTPPPAATPAANADGEAASQEGKGGEDASNFSGTSLYVGDLDPSVSEAQLYELFNQFGHVVSIRCAETSSPEGPWATPM
jgi:polyadenylate-binding protein